MARGCLILLWILLLNAVLPSLLAQNVTEAETTTEDSKNNEDDQSIWQKILCMLKTVGVAIGAQNVTEAETTTEDSKNNEDDQSTWQKILCMLKTVGVAIGVAIAVTLLAPLTVYIILWIIGFTLCGVMACSCAACCQSSIGNVAAGSCFSCLQSMGACGSIDVYVYIGLACGLPAGVISGYYAWFYFL